MSASPTSPSLAGASGPDTGFLTRHHFILRRLHSLSGIMPVGVFLLFHLFTNFQMLFGTFDHEVNWIHSLPALLFLEIFGLWLPIAFHAGLGVVYIFSGRANSNTYKYGDNIRYTLQRLTAWISLIFIFFHVATLRWGWSFGGLVDTPFLAGDAELAASLGLNSGVAMTTTAMALQHGPLHGWIITLFYIVGVYAVIYHWSNGLWTAAITWGITITKQAQQRWGMVCAGMGIVLSVFAGGAIYAARVHEVTPEERAAVIEYVQKVESGEIKHGH